MNKSYSFTLPTSIQVTNNYVLLDRQTFSKQRRSPQGDFLSPTLFTARSWILGLIKAFINFQTKVYRKDGTHLIATASHHVLKLKLTGAFTWRAQLIISTRLGRRFESFSEVRVKLPLHHKQWLNNRQPLKSNG